MNVDGTIPIVSAHAFAEAEDVVVVVAAVFGGVHEAADEMDAEAADRFGVWRLGGVDGRAGEGIVGEAVIFDLDVEPARLDLESDLDGVKAGFAGGAEGVGADVAQVFFEGEIGGVEDVGGEGVLAAELLERGEEAPSIVGGVEDRQVQRQTVVAN